MFNVRPTPHLQDECGTPSLAELMTEDERRFYADVEPNNRCNVVVASIQRIVERQRRLGNIYDKAAFEVYQECENVLAGDTAHRTAKHSTATVIL